MKNIQIIDEAINCTFDIFEIEDTTFEELFIEERDVEFEDDLISRLGEEKSSLIFNKLWSSKIDKKNALGIHGTIFFGDWCGDKKPFYPTKKEAEMSNSAFFNRIKGSETLEK